MKRRDAQITFRVPNPLRAELAAAAREAGLDLSELVRSILSEWATRRVERTGTFAALAALAPVLSERP